MVQVRENRVKITSYPLPLLLHITFRCYDNTCVLKYQPFTYLPMNCKNAVFGKTFFFRHWVIPEIIHAPCMEKIEKIPSSHILQIFHLPQKLILVSNHLRLNLQTFCFINLSIHPSDPTTVAYYKV